VKSTDPPEPGLPSSDEQEQPIALLLLWAESVADFACLPPRLRARLLSQLAEDIRHVVANMPDKELIYPWQVRHINEAFGFEVIPPPRRAWRVAPDGERLRVIGEG
jgi:hypothetical protein